MNYAAFRTLVCSKGWTVPFLRCENAPPTSELLEVMDELGLNKYERFVLRYENEFRFAVRYAGTVSEVDRFRSWDEAVEFAQERYAADEPWSVVMVVRGKWVESPAYAK